MASETLYPMDVSHPGASREKGERERRLKAKAPRLSQLQPRRLPAQVEHQSTIFSRFPEESKEIGCGNQINMQLYHHPYSMDSQKVRLALEEKGIDYTSYHINPLTGKNMDASFFRMNPSARLPVFQNGAHIIFQTVDIIQYIDRLTVSLDGNVEEENVTRSEKVNEWIHKIEGWSPKIFTLSHIPDKYRLFVSQFIRHVVIARMAESPDLASVYHVKLRDAYETEDKLKDSNIIKQSEEKLLRLLDDAELQLNETTYLAGEEFTMVDSMFVPVLARITLLNLDEEYINCRPNITAYYNLVKKRPSYNVVIGKYFTGWRKYQTLLKTLCFICMRKMFRKY